MEKQAGIETGGLTTEEMITMLLLWGLDMVALSLLVECQRRGSRYENRNLGIRFGPEDALFQLHEQKDSLAAVACGLGGGSLVNAGVMVPTPTRARRNPKWPKEWGKGLGYL
ncbi:CHOLESTEROL OXIDASE [Salix purpurea]|uniref:CHOLESTEROL OXIDASE n=1 Tax=Salix purpurea TaxID=77065 RepID=A0A9Q0T2A9_SALPP|nr:CHOLESTEROL OXIDASE [Salix purpurea]